MREIVHLQAGQCGNQIGAKVIVFVPILIGCFTSFSLVFVCACWNFSIVVKFDGCYVWRHKSAEQGNL